MFADLLSEEYAVPSIEEDMLTEFVLSDALRAELQQMFAAEERKYVYIGKVASQVQVDTQYVFFANAWFYLAVLCRPYAEAVYPYFCFLDGTIRSSAQLMRLVKQKQFTAPELVAQFRGDTQDADYFVRFLSGAKPFWPGKTIINGSGEGANLRGSKDTFGSAMLAKLDVPNASSGYLGNIIYYLVRRPALYDRLAAELNAQFAAVPAQATAPVEGRLTGGHNLIIYGAPGTGKSHCIDHDDDTDAKLGGKGYKYSDNLTRVVFHPEYTYYDFVGNFRPMPLYAASERGFHKYGETGTEVHEEPFIDYQFAAGPFTRVLVAAWNDPAHMYNLLLEELNRADAAAVFGDVFQLLDRDADGTSKYGIEPAEELGKYLREHIPDFDGVVRIPSNMNILATMNSSDQNVNLVDTAFKRRWKFHFMPIDYDAAPELARPVRYAGGNVPWRDFIRAINGRIVAPSGLALPEDRQVGPFFVDPYGLTSPDGQAAHDAVEKVLFYLWDDVTRNTGREKLFGKITTMEELYRRYRTQDVLGIAAQSGQAAQAGAETRQTGVVAVSVDAQDGDGVRTATQGGADDAQLGAGTALAGGVREAVDVYPTAGAVQYDMVTDDDSRVAEDAHGVLADDTPAGDA